MFQKGCMDDKGCSSNVALNSAVSNSNIAHLSWLVNTTLVEFLYIIYIMLRKNKVFVAGGARHERAHAQGQGHNASPGGSIGHWY